MPSFKEAFAAARKSGKKEFSWNGKKYNTKLKEETGVGKSVKPKARPVAAEKSVAPGAATKKPMARPGLVDKLTMGSKQRTGVNVSQQAVKMAEEKRKKAEAAKTATKGSPYKQISRYK